MITNDKKCSRCKETKLTNEFHKNRATKTGFANECKECRSEINKEGYFAGVAFLDEIRIGNEGNSDTAIRYATTDAWAETMLYLLENTEENPETGCYLFTQTKDIDGYARAHIPLPTTPYSTSVVTAHRLSFALSHGFEKLPLGLIGVEVGDEDVLDHLCGNRACVNASHLRVITHSQNSQLQTEERVAPKFTSKVICADFADESLLDLIARKSG